MKYRTQFFHKTFFATYLMWIGLMLLGTVGCGQSQSASSDQVVAQGESFISKATAYYPDSSALQGGFVDRKGEPLYTLQQYLAGNAPYVSVAMDVNAFPYGTELSIPEIEAYYKMQIVFRVVDTGGAFKNKGTTRIDICVKDLQSAYHPMVNKELQIYRID